jgi:hypothetical protein
MTPPTTRLLKAAALNEWRLFFLLSVPISVAIALAALRVDLSTTSGLREMIIVSVRWATPLIFVVTATSALQVLFPGPLPMWLLRNRKYVGLAFAVAMAWQGLFIFLVSFFHREYYYADVFAVRDELEGSTGYLFLAALVVTSFQNGRRYLTGKQWKLLHTSGVYFLWAYAFSVYWWNLFYYKNPQLIDHVFYWSGFAAFALRIAAWGKKRQQARVKAMQESAPPAIKALGITMIAAGMVVAATGLQWQGPVSALLTSPSWSATLERWLPYYPFQPFFSLCLIGLGTMLMTSAARAPGTQPLPVRSAG